MTENIGHNISAETPLPDKLYFRIGEVSDLVGVKPYVLRYWETEFSDIKPTKSKSGQRLYKRKDVELLLRIRDLLYKERFTINGAKKRLKEPDRAPVSAPAVKKESTEIKTGENGDLFGISEKVEETVEVGSSVKMAAPVAATNQEKKFLQKMKDDLEWCRNQLRS